MKARITYSLMSFSEKINLEHYGHEKDKKWSDLTEEEKNEITDSLQEQQIIEISGEDWY